MTYDLLIALAGFAFVTSITPGPNNLMLMASGANFGFQRTIPHMLGVGVGFVVMLLSVGLGVIGLFEAFPIAHTLLTVISVGYLIFLAWKIATAAPPGETAADARPMTFLQAALFQWVNPKSWAMALTGVTVYAPSKELGAVVAVGLVFGLINFPAVSSWTLLGLQMRRFLTSRTRLRLFNVTMAALLLATLYPMFA